MLSSYVSGPFKLQILCVFYIHIFPYHICICVCTLNDLLTLSQNKGNRDFSLMIYAAY